MFFWESKEIVRVPGKCQTKEKLVTQAHIIVSDGWAGASNPHPRPTPPTHIQGKYLKCSSSHFSTRAHGLTDGRTKPCIELRVRN